MERAQAHVHHIGDAIQPSHPLSSPSPPAPSPSQHQSLFQFRGDQRSGQERIGSYCFMVTEFLFGVTKALQVDSGHDCIEL